MQHVPSQHLNENFKPYIQLHVVFRSEQVCERLTVVVRFLAGQDFFFSSVKLPHLFGPTKRPRKKVPQSLFLGIKRPVPEADHLPQSSTGLRMTELFLHPPHTPATIAQEQ